MQPADDNSRPASGSISSRLEDWSAHAAKLRDRDRHVRAAAAQALGRSGAAQAVEALIVALQEEEPQVRFYAAWALWQLADARAVAPLCAALGDGVSEVRSAAAFALGRLGDVRAVVPLCTVFRGSDRTVRYPAAAALWEIGNAAALPLRILSATTLTPAQKLHSLEHLSGLAYTLDSGGRSRARAPEIGYPFGSVQLLCEKLCRQEDTAAEVRAGAEAALAELRNRAESAVLLRACGREEGRERAELLRGVSGRFEPTPPDELLRPAQAASELLRAVKPGILARIFRRR